MLQDGIQQREMEKRHFEMMKNLSLEGLDFGEYEKKQFLLESEMEIPVFELPIIKAEIKDL